MKIVIARMSHETSTFSPVVTRARFSGGASPVSMTAHSTRWDDARVVSGSPGDPVTNPVPRTATNVALWQHKSGAVPLGRLPRRAAGRCIIGALNA
jgi:hypothetical protein